MGIITQELYTVQCDNCKEVYSDGESGIGFWMHKSDDWEYANDDGWTIDLTDLKNEKHYCDLCHHYDDEDVLIINNEREVNERPTP